ncbi:MAG: hypothetical protein MHM6MM_006274 [Cercozoa sp. M6MM]
MSAGGSSFEHAHTMSWASADATHVTAVSFDEAGKAQLSDSKEAGLDIADAHIENLRKRARVSLLAVLSLVLALSLANMIVAWLARSVIVTQLGDDVDHAVSTWEMRSTRTQIQKEMSDLIKELNYSRMVVDGEIDPNATLLPSEEQILAHTKEQVMQHHPVVNRQLEEIRRDGIEKRKLGADFQTLMANCELQHGKLLDIEVIFTADPRTINLLPAYLALLTKWNEAFVPLASLLSDDLESDVSYARSLVHTQIALIATSAFICLATLMFAWRYRVVFAAARQVLWHALETSQRRLRKLVKDGHLQVANETDEDVKLRDEMQRRKRRAKLATRALCVTLVVYHSVCFGMQLRALDNVNNFFAVADAGISNARQLEFIVQDMHLVRTASGNARAMELALPSVQLMTNVYSTTDSYTAQQQRQSENILSSMEATLSQELQATVDQVKSAVDKLFERTNYLASIVLEAYVERQKLLYDPGNEDLLEKFFAAISEEEYAEAYEQATTLLPALRKDGDDIMKSQQDEQKVISLAYTVISLLTFVFALVVVALFLHAKQQQERSSALHFQSVRWTLPRILEEPELSSVFREYVRKKLCLEGILFYDTCVDLGYTQLSQDTKRALRQKTLTDDLAEGAALSLERLRQVYDDFIVTGCANEINISAGMRKDVGTALEQSEQEVHTLLSVLLSTLI